MRYVNMDVGLYNNNEFEKPIGREYFGNGDLFN